jgi:hypothetical protein
MLWQLDGSRKVRVRESPLKGKTVQGEKWMFTLSTHGMGGSAGLNIEGFEATLNAIMLMIVT